MRVCGNCGWILPHEDSGGYCRGTPEGTARLLSLPGCATWKPEQDWREEKCGTCEFNLASSCRRTPLVYGSGAILVYAEVTARACACAEWMPREEADDA